LAKLSKVLNKNEKGNFEEDDSLSKTDDSYYEYIELKGLKNFNNIKSEA
jgi:hypothetical protein